MILAAKFQTLPLVVASVVEPRSPPYRELYLLAINRLRWVVNAAIILWYSVTAPCFGAQPTCNAHVRSQSYFSTGSATQMPPRVAAIFSTSLGLFFLYVDLEKVYKKYALAKRMERKFPGWKKRRLDKISRVQRRLKSGLYSCYIGEMPFWAIDNTSPLPLQVGTDSLPLPNTTNAAAHIFYSTLSSTMGMEARRRPRRCPPVP